MTAVLKHELRGYAHSLSSYLFCAFLLLFVGVGALLYNIQSAVANFEYVLEFVCIGLTVIIPVLTMRVIAEERRARTDQLLYSLPLTTAQIVAGKYLALLVVYLVPLCVVALYPLIFAQYGDVYLLTAYGSLFAFFIMGAAMIAVGMFISSLTDSQGFAAGIAIVVFAFNYFSVTLAENISATAVRRGARPGGARGAAGVRRLPPDEKRAHRLRRRPRRDGGDRCRHVHRRRRADLAFADADGKAVALLALHVVRQRRVRRHGHCVLTLCRGVFPLPHRAVA